MPSVSSLVRQMFATIKRIDEATNKHTLLNRRLLNYNNKNFTRIIQELERIENRILYLQNHLGRLGRTFTNSYPQYANYSLGNLQTLLSR